MSTYEMIGLIVGLILAFVLGYAAYRAGTHTFSEDEEDLPKFKWHL